MLVPGAALRPRPAGCTATWPTLHTELSSAPTSPVISGPHRSTRPSKSELIRGPNRCPWKSVEDVELATLGWVHWHNTDRLHGYPDDVPSSEFEAAYAAQQADQQLVGIQ